MQAEKIFQKWKSIKRNGNFARKKRSLITSIGRKNTWTVERNSVSDLERRKIVSRIDHASNVCNILQQSDNRDSNIDIDVVNVANNTEQDNVDAMCYIEPNIEPKKSFVDELSTWALQCQVKHSALNKLLAILKSAGGHEYLPADARTLVKTPRDKVELKNFANSKFRQDYWHYGLQKVVKEALSGQPGNYSLVNMNVNIDGVPMFRSSSKSFWPILVELHELRNQLAPLIVGIFCGKSK